MGDTKLAICFFGLLRSLSKTIMSLEKNIFNVLKEHQIEYDIYVHTYDVQHLCLKRSGENVKLNTDDYKLLHSDFIQIDDQQQFLENYPCSEIFEFGDPWKTDFQNSKNLLCQLNSLQQVTQMWIPKVDNYFGCLYLRPDIEYTVKLPMKSILYIKNHPNENIILLPKWMGYKGFNDRMALGSTLSMKHYGSRIDYAIEYCKNNKKPLHSERFLKNFILTNNIKVQYLGLVGIRIRGNLKREKKDETKLRHITKRLNKINKKQNQAIKDKVDIG